MARRRWIADRHESGRAWLVGENARHLSQSLRAEPGQQYEVAVPAGVYLATIVSTELDEVEFRLTEQIQSERSILEIHLLLSVFKFDRMEWAIEKAVELGCEDITPVIASRTDKHLAAAATKRVERWRKIAREAAQQSRQSGVPNISPPVPLKEAVQQARGARIVLNERERVTRLVDLVRSPQPTITLAVGPEGGWTDGELGHFQQAGWTAASLGCFILRAETATIAALVTAQASLPQN